MEHCSQATVIFALVLVHVFVILALVVAWACAWLGPGVFAASSTLVLTLLLALVGIPESGTGVAPGRIHRSLGAALVVLLTAAATFYPWEKNGRGGIATCLEEGAEVPYFDGSPWYFGKDALMCWLHALLAALCLSMPHPNSRYARVVVWAVVAIWLETYCWLVANTYWLCLAMPGHGDKLFRDLVRSFGFNLDVLGQAWTAVLLLRRVRAVESSFGESVGAWKLQWLLFVGTLTSTVAAFLLTWINVAKGTNFPGQLQRPLVTDIFYFISSAIWFLCGFTFSYAFTTPCVLLKQEAKSLESAPLAEALWAARRLKVERAASMTTSFLTSLNFMGRAVCGIWSKQMPVPVWFFLDVLMWDFDDLANAISLAVLSGLLYQDRPPELQKPENDCDLKDNCRSCDCCGGNEADWQVKVHELASRSVGVLELVNFVQKLKEPSLMPSFLPEMSTTNDVVRQAIIPLSRREDTGFALASLWSGGAPRPPTKMVTHAWDNTFSHLVASIVADAMGVATYSGIAAQLCSERLPEVVEDLEQLHRRSQYWICAFCINQHSCICSGFGAEPIFGTPQFDEWDTKRRDTVTGDVYPLCRCSHPKYFNSSPNECEMNKFDDMIHLLHCEIPDFILVASVDYYFQIFMRAWCVAELVEAETCGISLVMKIHSEELLDHYYNELSRLDVRACKASRAEDKAMILYRIRNVDAFNARLQWLIFGSQGLFKSWADAHQRAKMVGRIARRVQKRQAGNTGEYIVPVKSRYSGGSQGVSKIDEVLCRLRRGSSNVHSDGKKSKSSSSQWLPSSSESSCDSSSASL